MQLIITGPEPGLIASMEVRYHLFQTGQAPDEPSYNAMLSAIVRQDWRTAALLVIAKMRLEKLIPEKNDLILVNACYNGIGVQLANRAGELQRLNATTVH